ncbi:MAG: TetR/AcrR family transcriptional regulator [Spirochaetales bacterium]|nr:TetR/AcrR family transcriptional regulator [Spirochaetales bacterium]
MKIDKRRNTTKEKLMENAALLFAEKGYDAVSIRDITGKTNVSPASFYNHFSSKNHLLEQVYDYYQEQIIGPVERSIDLEGMLQQHGIRGFLNKLVRMMYETEHDVKLMAYSRIIAIEQYKNKTAAKIVQKARNHSRKLMVEIFTSMQKLKMIAIESPEAIADIFSYMLTGVAADYYYHRYVLKKSPAKILELYTTQIRSFCTYVLKIREENNA